MSRRIVVFVPGLFGSQLASEAGTLWPPSLGDYIRSTWVSQADVDAKLRVREATAGPILRRVNGTAAYSAVLGRLERFMPSRPKDTLLLVEAPYDWRRPLLESAHLVAEVIERGISVSDKKTAEFVLVGHSMGGLVARLILETSIKRKFNWVSRVRGLITVATPHRGSIDALMGARGLVNQYGVRGSTIRRLVLDRYLLSLIDLFPPPDQPIVVQQEGQFVTGVLTTSEFLERFDEGLTTLYRRNSAVHSVLKPYRERGRVPYVCIGSATHRTSIRLSEIAGRFEPIPYLRSGDGRVAIDSALLSHAIPIFFKGDHLGVCDTDLIENAALYMLGLAPLARAFAGTGPKLRISISPIDPHVGEPLEIYTECSPELPQRCRLLVSRIEDGAKVLVDEREVRAPEYWVRDLALEQPGRYIAEIHDADRVLRDREFFLYGTDDDYVPPPAKSLWDRLWSWAR